MFALQLLAPLAATAALTAGSSLYSSSQLWATLDICNAPDRPHTLGIRGSMPGDGHGRDTMLMRFRVQYYGAGGGRRGWAYLAQADSGYQPVGSAATARQGGYSFVFAPPAPGKAPFALRGVVSYQWRRGTRVVHTTTRATSAGHRSLAGADPKGFSAATCTLA
jgi:hypothetical protein